MIDTIDVRDTSRERLWRDYICKRQPVLINGHIKDAEWHATKWWTDDYLIRTAGKAIVQVESRDDNNDTFGRGRRSPIPFGEVVRRLAAGDTTLYLTSQPVGVASDGHPELYAEPLTSLAKDFPMVPAIMGSLVPQQVNLWMGGATDGATSGLHHDFHDNLYVLLRGRKRFRLYPPHLASRMYTHGAVAKIHGNGRIVYQGQGEVLADGSDAADVARWRARTAAEEAVAAAEAAVAAGKPGAKKALAAAERRLEEALDAALDDFDDFDGLSDEEGLSSSDDASADESDDDGWGDKGANCKRRFGKAPARKKAKKTYKQAGKEAKGAQEPEPPSFSRIDLRQDDASLRAAFSKFPGKAAALEVTVEAGQMLYLPAGWFHEVTSFSGPKGGAHMAFNFWFHPPDNLAAPNGCDKPYTSDFFPALWRARQQELTRQSGAEAAAAAAAAPTGRDRGAVSSAGGRSQPDERAGSDQSEKQHARRKKAKEEAGSDDGPGSSGVGGEEGSQNEDAGALAVPPIPGLTPDAVRQLFAQFLQRHADEDRKKKRKKSILQRGRRHHYAVTMRRGTKGKPA